MSRIEVPDGQDPLLHLWGGTGNELTGPAAAFSDAVYRRSTLPLREFEAARITIAREGVTSDPTLRAVFAEDSAALTGLLIAAAGLAAHQLTGSPIPDAAGSILIGVLLAVIAIVLININRQFLIGQEADPRVRGRHPGLAGCAGGRPGDLSAAGDRWPADDLGGR